MDRFTASDFHDLIQEKRGPCISIYMPTYVLGQDAQQNPVRLKNLLQQAENELADGWLRAADGRKLLEPARDVLTDSLFWEGGDRGLAMFLSPEQWTAFRLSREFEELVVVNRRYYVKPLIPLLNGREHFHILTLSQNNTRLFEASRYSIEQLKVKGWPSSMDKALNYTSADRGSQAHSAAQGQLGKQGAVFHGQGGVPDSHKDDLTQYFRLVDHVVKKTLHESNSPLLLAGVDYLLPIYREVNSYAHVSSNELRGNFDYEAPGKLLEKAWSEIEPSFQAERESVLSRYRELAGTGKTSDNVEQIVPAAYDGRIDTMFVDETAHQWGLYAKDSRFIEVHEEFQQGDEDLLDVAAVETLSHKGTVYAVKRDAMPADRLIVALLRY